MTNDHYFSAPALPRDDLLRQASWIRVRVRGVELEMATGGGTFSRGALDEGSRLLLETATWASGANVCDLGCGWGAVGCVAAKLSLGYRVALCDVNPRATTLAKHNAEHNALPNAVVWCGDALSSCRDELFDAVLCNPPVRAGNETIARMFDDAHRCLKPGGALWVVLRTAQGAKSWQKRLAAQFGACETVAMGGGYRILRSVKAQENGAA